MDSIELTSRHAVAIAQATVSTARLANIERRGDSARLRTVELVSARALLAGSAATYRRHTSLLHGSRLAEVSGDRGHHLSTCNRTEESRDIVILDQSLRHVTTSGKTAASAVCTRKHLLDLIDARIFFDLELLGHEVENYCRENTQSTQGQHSKE